MHFSCPQEFASIIHLAAARRSWYRLEHDIRDNVIRYGSTRWPVFIHGVEYNAKLNVIDTRWQVWWRHKSFEREIGKTKKCLAHVQFNLFIIWSSVSRWHIGQRNAIKKKKNRKFIPLNIFDKMYVGMVAPLMLYPNVPSTQNIPIDRLVCAHPLYFRMRIFFTHFFIFFVCFVLFGTFKLIPAHINFYSRQFYSNSQLRLNTFYLFH